jgi:hypothetical protein
MNTSTISNRIIIKIELKDENGYFQYLISGGGEHITYMADGKYYEDLLPTKPLNSPSFGIENKFKSVALLSEDDFDCSVGKYSLPRVRQLLEYLRKQYNVVYPPVVREEKDKYKISYQDINDHGNSTTRTAYNILFFGRRLRSKGDFMIYDDWRISPEIVDIIKSSTFEIVDGCYISKHFKIKISTYSEDMSHEENRLLMVESWLAFIFFNKGLTLGDIKPELVESFGINQNHITLINNLMMDDVCGDLESFDKHSFHNKYEPIKGIMALLEVDIDTADQLYNEMLEMYPIIVKETMNDTKVYKVDK